MPLGPRRTIRNLRKGRVRSGCSPPDVHRPAPINTLVDITNFFTVDLGPPLHVFDVTKLSGNVLMLRPGSGARPFGP